MRDLSKLRERFLRDRIAIQLGNIASNLARIDNFIRMVMEQAAITDLLDETKAMIEWAGLLDEDPLPAAKQPENPVPLLVTFS